MNEASRWRLAMARKIAPVYTTDARVSAIVVGGSVARGCADHYSDVEIGIFWNEFPDAAELEAAKERARSTTWEMDPYNPDEDDVWYEEYAVGGLKIDLRHMTTARMGEVLAAVLAAGDLSEPRQQIIAAMHTGIVLHSASLVESWQARTAHYPDSLARAMVRKHMEFQPWWGVSTYAERGELPLVYGAFNEATHGIFGALLGLNRIYHPGLKWMNQTIAGMQIAPPDLAARLKEAFRIGPPAGVRLTQALIEETFALVEQHMPEVDLSEPRRRFRSERPVMDAAPRGWLE
jgi:predicted nucleotidyltransferase